MASLVIWSTATMGQRREAIERLVGFLTRTDILAMLARPFHDNLRASRGAWLSRLINAARSHQPRWGNTSPPPYISPTTPEVGPQRPCDPGKGSSRSGSERRQVHWSTKVGSHDAQKGHMIVAGNGHQSGRDTAVVAHFRSSLGGGYHMQHATGRAFLQAKCAYQSMVLSGTSFVLV